MVVAAKEEAGREVGVVKVEVAKAEVGTEAGGRVGAEMAAAETVVAARVAVERVGEAKVAVGRAVAVKEVAAWEMVTVAAEAAEETTEEVVMAGVPWATGNKVAERPEEHSEALMVARRAEVADGMAAA
jgi:hypothetical protein